MAAAHQRNLMMRRTTKDPALAVRGEAGPIGLEAGLEFPRRMGDPPVSDHLQALLELELEELLLAHLELEEQGLLELVDATTHGQEALSGVPQTSVAVQEVLVVLERLQEVQDCQQVALAALMLTT